ncbi:MAG TPA: carboxypeptidase regulatory-like domain-containing protein [Vicinamibacterales bacterium]|nr:carboxypeptidase regulatory-like domain-containing protein [Vicinamibacterales bacterium]
MTCWSSHVGRYGLVAGAVVLGLVSWSTAAGAQAPAAPAQMNMADHRGAIRGTVRNAAGAVADTTVTAVQVENGARFVSTTDAQGAYSFGALPVGKYDVSLLSASGLTTFRRRGVEVAMDKTEPLDITLDAASAAEAAEGERQELLQKIATLEQRVGDLESTTVLSEPETRVRRVEVFVDPNGAEHDDPVPGATPKITYRRERTYRRQTISEKIDAALEDAASHSVTVGVDAAVATQFAKRREGDNPADGRAYALASADLFFTAGIAQNTLFFADIVGLSGSPPDAEIPTLTLINGYTARLVAQNELNLREAWLRTEVFGNRLALTAGRLDLTNYFDANAFANDESTQFISDALVNNQMLGLAVNGTGAAAEFDPKNGLRFKFGLQQSNTDATNLSDSMFTLSEVGYTFTPFALPEGTYRVWFRTDNSIADSIRKGVGLSLDQKLSAAVGLFARYGRQQTDLGDDDRFFSVGVGFQKGFIFNPDDMWGVGYAQMDLATGETEKLVEGYYNFLLTEKLRLSFHLTGVLDKPETGPNFGYVFPGVRLQAAF